MFVSKARFKDTERVAKEWAAVAGMYKRQYEQASQMYLVMNKAFTELQHLYATTRKGQPAFNEDEMRKLLALCHPDKHDGKPMAVEMTQKLLAMRG